MDSDDVFVRASVRRIVRRVAQRMSLTEYSVLLQYAEECVCQSYQEALQHTRDPDTAEREAEMSAEGIFQMSGLN